MTDTQTRPTLTDGNLCLRVPRADDVHARVAAGNHAEIQHMYGAKKGSVEPITHDKAEKWVEYHQANPNSWFIDVDGRLSGVIFLHGVNKIDKRAILAMGLLHPKDFGKGYGTRALHLLLAEAFNALGLHRLSLRVLSYNDRAIATYKKVGFVLEGCERESALVGDKWYDDLLMGLLETEYKGVVG
ncbi:GNAT family protein [uncultured Sulfitobacter sp.]|uniref:GNAT family N-acetyltransferase n=1 Tax=uncultured Sulfitobacter sp. TaxID=191468 RepID=UPI00262BBF62|nr:GNAT family protein [uncultured Sulfitobacter sp.]